MKPKFFRTSSGSFIRPVVNRIVLNLKVNMTSIDVSSFDFGSDLSMDSTGLASSYATNEFDINRLAGLEIIIIGAGSVGSHVAYALAPAQLKITLIDSDRIEQKHTQSGRTLYDSTQIGQLKVYAAKEKIEKNFLGTSILPFAYNVADIPGQELIEWFKKAAIIVLVIDDPSQILRINRLCYPLKSIVQCGIHRQGHSAHIVFTIPWQTPCLACTLGITTQQDIRRLDSEPAAGIDISIAAQLTSRIVLDLLYSKVTQKPITRWNVSKNLIFISNTQQITPDGPGIQYDSSSRRADCDICR